MAINSKRKGKVGELECAAKLREYGYQTRRTAQFCGNTGEAADIVGIPLIHAEVKRTETLRLYDALDQARRDAKSGKIPVVFHRKNNCDWVCILRLDDFMKLYAQFEINTTEKGAP